MGQVIALNKNVRPEVVRYFEDMAAKARCGEVQGWAGFADMASGPVKGMCIGSLADNPERTAKVARSALEVFCEKTGVKKMESPANECDSLPRRMRAG